MNVTEFDLSIVIVNWNTRALLLQTVQSVYDNPPGRYSFEIIVVDNGSTDGSQEALAAGYPQVQLIANRDNRGFGPANNQGLKLAKGRYSLMLNSDTIVQPGSLEKIIDFMDAHPKAGMCGIRVLNGDGSFQGSYADYLTLWSEFLILTGLGRRLITPDYPSYGEARSLVTKPVDTIQGAFMFARTSALREIGWLDERFFMYGEENDLGLRLNRAGWQVYYLADITVIHLGGQSSSKSWRKVNWQLQKSKVLLFRKHYGFGLALLLKLLISLAVLSKWSWSQLKGLFKNSGKEHPNWFKWSDLQQFWKV